MLPAVAPLCMTVVLGPETRPALSLKAAVFFVPDDRFPVTWSGRAAVVAVPVELDLTIADGLREALLGALNAGALGLVVDMTTTTFCDSAGISALTRAVRRAAAHDATMRLAVTSQAVLRVLDLVGIDRLIEIYPDTGAALESLPDRDRNLS
jgi:anti-sigma B factor antagonist